MLRSLIIENLSLIFSVVALTVVGITVLVILGNRAIDHKRGREALEQAREKASAVSDDYDAMVEANRAHMKAVEEKLDKLIELIQKKQ